MTSPIIASDRSGPILVAYKLTIEDVRRFVEAEDLRCWTCLIRSQKTSTAILAGLILGLAALCGLELGLSVGLWIFGAALVLLGTFAWSRRFAARRRACRLASDLGLPCELRVAVSSQGIAKASGPGLDDPGRRYPWSEVVESFTIPGLIGFRLRPAGGMLLIPDHAFGSPEARLDFLGQVRRWHEAAPFDRSSRP